GGVACLACALYERGWKMSVRSYKRELPFFCCGVSKAAYRRSDFILETPEAWSLHGRSRLAGVAAESSHLGQQTGSGKQRVNLNWCESFEVSSLLW
ncbi:mCG145212, partial [Mus musculus]